MNGFDYELIKNVFYMHGLKKTVVYEMKSSIKQLHKIFIAFFLNYYI